MTLAHSVSELSLAADWKKFAVCLKKDIEGKYGTLKRGTLCRIEKVTTYPTNTNLTLKDKDGNFTVLIWPIDTSFPHEIVPAHNVVWQG